MWISRNSILWISIMVWKQRLKGAQVPPYCLAKYTLICLDPNQFLPYFNWTWSKELKNNLNHKTQLNFQKNSHWQFKILKICLTKCINLCLQAQNWQPKPNCWSTVGFILSIYLISKNSRISSKKLGKSNLIYSRKIEISKTFPIVLPKKRKIKKTIPGNKNTGTIKQMSTSKTLTGT
jgi:hypothetical protein